MQHNLQLALSAHSLIKMLLLAVSGFILSMLLTPIYTTLAYRWPAPPWDLLLYGGMVMMVVTPVLFYPFSKDLFLAFDLIFRPPAPEDFG